MINTTQTKNQTFKKEVWNINKDIKELDIRIIKIETEKDTRDDIYFISEVGLYESLGEQGLNITEFYDTKPTEEEIIKDTKDYLIKEKEELKNRILSGREERYLEILEGLKL